MLSVQEVHWRFRVHTQGMMVRNAQTRLNRAGGLISQTIIPTRKSNWHMFLHCRWHVRWSSVQRQKDEIYVPTYSSPRALPSSFCPVYQRLTWMMDWSWYALHSVWHNVASECLTWVVMLLSGVHARTSENNCRLRHWHCLSSSCDTWEHLTLKIIADWFRFITFCQ